MKKRMQQVGHWWLAGCGLLLSVVLASYTAWSLERPLPALQPQLINLPARTTASTLNWPTPVQAGQAAVGIVGSSILETNGPQTPVPTASTAKIISALVILQHKPLTAGNPGPLITLTANDTALYDNYAAAGGSVVPVQAGEQISEYQMLQAMLLPSANNMADSLAVWAFGSLPAYSAAANTYLQAAGLTSTHVGNDASGFLPTTTSTAHDLVRLGELAMQNPVLAAIVGQPTAEGLPVVGTIKNVNFLLGGDNVIGIKTGNTDAAGGVFISASRVSVNSQPVTIVTVLAGAPTLFAALKYSRPLIESAQANFGTVTVVKAGTVVGRYSQPWGGQLDAVASRDLITTVWKGSTVAATTHLQPITTPSNPDRAIGSLTTPSSPFAPPRTALLILRFETKSPTQPTLWWRLRAAFP